jgi:hypothetical protein
MSEQGLKSQALFDIRTNRYLYVHGQYFSQKGGSAKDADESREKGTIER